LLEAVEVFKYLVNVHIGLGACVDMYYTRRVSDTSTQAWKNYSLYINFLY